MCHAVHIRFTTACACWRNSSHDVMTTTRSSPTRALDCISSLIKPACVPGGTTVCRSLLSLLTPPPPPPLLAVAPAPMVVNRDNDNYFHIKAGPTIGVAVIAWVFGLAGGSAILLLRPHATPGQDGPLRRFSRREGVRSAPRPRAPSSPSGVTI